MGNKDCLRVRGSGHLLQGVEVLIHEEQLHHLRLRDVSVGERHLLNYEKKKHKGHTAVL